MSQLKFDNLQKRIIISHEFGLSNDVYHTQIPKGATIYHSKSGITRVFDANGNQMMISDDITSPKENTTTGYLPVSKIYEVPDNSLIREKGNKTMIYADNIFTLTVIDDNIGIQPPFSSEFSFSKLYCSHLY